MLEGDSTDGTFDGASERGRRTLRDHFAGVTLIQRDFGFRLPGGCAALGAADAGPAPRVLAKARNHLLFSALREEEWVLWLDVDVIDYPADIIERLLATGKHIVHPHCVLRPGGPTFDLNAWRHTGASGWTRCAAARISCGSTPWAARCCSYAPTSTATGLIFPPYLYGAESRFARVRGRSRTRRRGGDRGTGNDGQGHGRRVLGDARPGDRASQRSVTRCVASLIDADRCRRRAATGWRCAPGCSSKGLPERFPVRSRGRSARHRSRPVAALPELARDAGPVLHGARTGEPGRRPVAGRSVC